MSSIIGQTLGKYEIVDLLGQGGMATVYKGYQADIDRYVAIKILPPHPGQDPDFVKRFQLEARTIARLQHPHILPVYDYGAENGVLYLAVAYIQGGSLADRIDRGPMPLQNASKLLNEIASALDYAHRQSVVHRDIKPDNILLNTEGYALLADFGIAKLVGGDSKLTATGGLVGTPAYMAPEQATGGNVGAAADIYALGIVTFEMISGRLPYTADTPMQIVMKHVTDPVPHLSDVIKTVPPALEVVMSRALAKDPADRYPTATAFADDVRRAMSGEDAAISLRPERDTMPMGTPPPGVTPPPGTAPPTQAPMPTQAQTSTDSIPPGLQPTLLTRPGTTNTLLLGGGLLVIALLVVAVIALVIFVTSSNAPPTVQATEAAVQPTAVVSGPTAVPVPNFGRATFSSAEGLGDTINLRVEGLMRPISGNRYVAWLVNTADDTQLNIGTLTIDGLGNSVLSYTDPEGRMLAGMFNAVWISTEASEGEIESPAGEVAYSGRYPVEFGQALQEILGASDEGINGQSLYASALAEANTARQHAGLAAGSTNLGGVLTHTEHTINILQGTEEDYNGNGRGENPSSAGIGVGHFLDMIVEHLDNGLSAPGASLTLQSEGELIRVCAENSRQFMDELLAVENRVLSRESFEAAAGDLEESTALAETLISGRDQNGNGQVEPFEGECGLEQIETFGVLAALLEITEGSLS